MCFNFQLSIITALFVHLSIDYLLITDSITTQVEGLDEEKCECGGRGWWAKGRIRRRVGKDTGGEG